MGRQQDLDTLPQVAVAAAGRGEKGRPLLDGAFQDLMEETFFPHDESPHRLAGFYWHQRERGRESTSKFQNRVDAASPPADLGLEPGTGVGPVAIRGGRGNAQNLGGLVAAQSGEVTQ